MKQPLERWWRRTEWTDGAVVSLGILMLVLLLMLGLGVSHPIRME